VEFGYHHIMFSYRHAFHAGNHADVLKHMILVATLKHLQHKEPGLTLIDTHAGAGLYRLDGDYSETGAEAQYGIFKLLTALQSHTAIPEALQDYLDVIAHFNPNGKAKIYPGSPFILHHMMRHASRDRLKLFEMHPTDAKTLASNVAQLDAGRAIMIAREDGFESLKKLLPPPPSSTGSRRAMVLMDPSYEIKSDYGKVTSTIQDCLKRFATGTYVVWYPLIARVEAHDLPKRLKTLANQAQKPWLHATLSIGRHEDGTTAGLAASGMVVINPPFSLKDKLREAMDVVGPVLARGTGHSFSLEHS